MRRNKLALSILALGLVAISLGADSPAPVVDATNVSTFYKDYKRLTKQPRKVGARLWAACASIPLPGEQTYGPHADGLVNICVNPAAEKTVAAGPKTAFPAGSVIVKEKLSADGSVIGVGGMIKRAAGYDKEHGDWEYFYYAKAPGFSSGKLTNCVNCHNVAKDSDYVYSVWALKE